MGNYRFLMVIPMPKFHSGGDITRMAKVVFANSFSDIVLNFINDFNENRDSFF